jgi:hypothetical protein
MAHLWLHDASADWVVLPLEEDAYAIAEVRPDELSVQPASAPAAARAVLVRSSAGDAEAWFALAPPSGDVLVNGLPLTLGLRALRDRDEIGVPGQGSFFFSTEMLARTVPFPGAPQPIMCPRCLQEIGPGVSAVRCPRCGVWYHASAELPCWTYAETCQLCPQLTAQDAGYRWTPEDL